MRSISLLRTLLSSPAITLIAVLTAAFILPPVVGSGSSSSQERSCAAGASALDTRVLPTAVARYLTP
jgi:hypothetical protein